jgi:hypothetical protein
MKKALGLVFLTAGLAMSITSVTAASQDATVNVTVDTKTELDVRPTTLSYNASSGGLEPGQQATSADEYNGYSTIEVENIGSTNISEIYAESSYPQDDPFGTGVDSEYDSGNFIQISTNEATTSSYGTGTFAGALADDSTDQNFHYVNRVEFEDYPVQTYIDTVSSTGDLSFSSSISSLNTDVGRFREGDQWYFYAIYYGDNGQGACSGGTNGDSEIWVGNDPHTSTSTGTTDLSQASNAQVVDIQQTTNNNIGVTNETISLNANGNTREYDVYTYCDANSPNSITGSTLRTRFNVDPTYNTSEAFDAEGTTISDITAQGGISELSSTTAILDDGGTAGSNLNPGAYFPVDVTVELPQGVASGEINGGRLTIQAVSQSNS